MPLSKEYGWHPDFEGEFPTISTTGLVFAKTEADLMQRVCLAINEIQPDSLNFELLPDRVNPVGRPICEDNVLVRVINKKDPHNLEEFWRIVNPAKEYKKDLKDLPKEEQQTLIDQFVKRRTADVVGKKDPLKDVLEW